MPPITALANRQFKIVAALNPVKMGDFALWFETWSFFRDPNRELNKARSMAGYFTAAAVTRQMSSSPQPLYAQREPRPIELIWPPRRTTASYLEDLRSGQRTER